MQTLCINTIQQTRGETVAGITEAAREREAEFSGIAEKQVQSDGGE